MAGWYRRGIALLAVAVATVAVVAYSGAGGGSSGAGGAAGTGSQWACWPMPNPVAANLPNPAGYDTTTPGVVLDKVTGLMWQRTVDAKSYAWSAAKTYCAGLTLAGHSDWRLPSEIELFSLVDYTVRGPAIDTAAFPSTPVDRFWSSSPQAGQTSGAWAVPFDVGFPGYDLVTHTFRLRCVRPASDARANAPPGRYTIAGGTVTDNATKLVWQRAVAPSRYTWKQARSYCTGLALPGGGWRVPSVKELMTLVDFSVAQPGPLIDTTAFPNTLATLFWTSSLVAGQPSHAWVVHFYFGNSYSYGVTVTIRVRCVR